VSALTSSSWPNPFNPAVTISYAIPSAGDVSVRIFSAEGRLLRTLISDETVHAGHHSVVWDGTDETGGQVGSGVYFYEVVHQEARTSAKMVLLK